jgi:4-diphosphocytidyl-2-C-methyl-D-erythritol kinase
MEAAWIGGAGLDDARSVRRPRAREWASAKVQLFLAVGPRRSDGYHDLVTVFETVPIRDLVEVEVRPTGSDRGWSYRVRPASSARDQSVAATGLPLNLDNLAGKAAARFVTAMLDRLGQGGAGAGQGGAASETVRPAEISVTIDKRIPIAAGLGGGSSDAAALLRGLQRAFGHPLAPETLLEVAERLGSDVPFFFRGGRAVGRSRGEDLASLPREPRLPLVLGLPSFPLNTPDVYGEFDRLARPGGVRSGGPLAAWARRENDLSVFLEVLAAGDLSGLAACLRNDLRAAAISLRPEIGSVLEALRRAGCLGAEVSGSGPSVFGLAPSLEAAADAARASRACLPAELRDLFIFRPVLSGMDCDSVLSGTALSGTGSE